MEQKRIAIVGGGIAGITCAIALQQRFFEVDVFEQAPEIKEIGAILGVLPNGMQVINAFGLLEEFIKKGGPLKEFRVNMKSGKNIRNTYFNYKLPAIVVRRSDLLNALLSKIDSTALHPNHKLIDYELLSNQKILLHFVNGKKLEYDAVIAADGINSVIRAKMIGDGAPVYRGYNLWRGVGTVNDSFDFAAEVWGAGQRFGLYPLPNKMVGWWAAIEEEKDASDEPLGSKQKLLKAFEGWQTPIQELILSTDHIIKNHISDRKPLKKWFDGNVCMIGDAAHCTTPNLGQGANMAMESAFLLARCIEKYGLNEQAYSKFQELQFQRTESINRQSLMIGKLGQLKNPIAQRFRNLILKALPLSVAQKIYDDHYDYDVSILEI